MSDLHIVVGLRAKKGKERELEKDLIALVEPTRKEEGNLRYELFVNDEDPGYFVFVEQWTSADAQLRHHNHGPHIQHFNAHGATNVEGITFLHRLTRIA
ncbi:putative quinol monooxygenase [Pseudomonas sp. MT3]